MSLYAFVLVFTTVSAPAATLFESGTLGPTGIARSEIANGTVEGTNVSASIFVGIRFYLDQPVVTAQVGGHFVKNTGGNESFFGAIVALTDQNDFPDSANLATPDLIGTTMLAFPEPSDEVFGSLAKPLMPGWYALVFGSGIFGATGSGVAVRNGMDIGDPAYIGYQPGSGWVNIISPFFDNHRFVIEGATVPEPSTIVFVAVIFVVNLLGCSSRKG
jgi:hypothetical protein